MYVPVAVNCCVAPATIVGFAGVTVMDIRVAEPTIREAEPEALPDAAVIVVVPRPESSAKPLVPTLLLTTATVADDEDHTDVAVMSLVLSSV